MKFPVSLKWKWGLILISVDHETSQTKSSIRKWHESKREIEKEKEWEWTIKWRERNINVRCNKTNDAQSKKFILKQRNGNKEKSDIKRGCRGKQIYKIWDFFMTNT